MKRFGFALALLIAAASIPASAYYHFVYYLNSGIAPAKFDLTALPNKTVWFFVSEAGPTSYSANDGFSSVVSQIRQAVQVWNGVSTSDLRVGFGGLENASTAQNTPAGDVVFEDLAPGLLGYGGPTTTAAPVTPASGSPVFNAPWVPITRTAIHMNLNQTIAPGPSYSEEFFLVMVHEMGHALGLQHTFTSAAMSTATTSATSQADPIDVDDIAGLSVLYPNASFAQTTGSITGTITSAGSGVHLESVVAIRSGAGAVSALTNPDGTFEIDGVPPGNYLVYAHALPPTADIVGPWNPDGSVAAASGPTNALFYPGTTSLGQATPITVKAGATQTGIDIDVATLATLPIYDVAVYGYFDNNAVAVKPAYLNALAGNSVVVATGVGLGSNGQAPGLNAVFDGDSAIVESGGVQPYQVSGNTYIALDIEYFLFGSAGPQHLVITTPTFMHVLPTAVRVTTNNPPAIQSVSANGDGTLTVTGKNWLTGSAIYFDGLPAAVVSLDPHAGKAVVVPPAGASGQTAVLTVYNPDGQNSGFVQASAACSTSTPAWCPVAYTYGVSSKQTIAAISPASLPAGAEAMVDITGSGFNFVAGQVAVGFGTSDIVVRQVFVLGPNHLQADISIAPGAALGSPDVSVFNGFQMATATAGLHITAPVTGLPAAIPILANAVQGLTGTYAGAIVSLYGTNLAAASGTPVITIGGLTAPILYSSPTQINLQIPSGVASGAEVLKLFNGALNAFPVTVNVDTPPATITGIQDNGGNTIGPSYPAVQGDLLIVSLSGFAPDGTVIAPAEVQISVNGLMHNALNVTQPESGIFQTAFLLNQNDMPGNAQQVIVYLNGRSSYPVTIPVTASTPGVD